MSSAWRTMEPSSNQIVEERMGGGPTGVSGFVDFGGVCDSREEEGDEGEGRSADPSSSSVRLLLFEEPPAIVVEVGIVFQDSQILCFINGLPPVMLSTWLRSRIGMDSAGWEIWKILKRRRVFVKGSKGHQPTHIAPFK